MKAKQKKDINYSLSYVMKVLEDSETNIIKWYIDIVDLNEGFDDVKDDSDKCNEIYTSLIEEEDNKKKIRKKIIEANVTTIKKHIRAIAKFLNCSDGEAIFFTMCAFSHFTYKSSTSMQNVSNLLCASPVDVMPFTKFADNLVKKHILFYCDKQYTINKKVIHAIETNKKLTELPKLNRYEFVNSVINGNCVNDQLNLMTLFESDLTDDEFVKRMISYCPNEKDRLIAYYIAYLAMNPTSIQADFNLVTLLTNIFEISQPSAISAAKKYVDGSHEIIKQGFAEVTSTNIEDIFDIKIRMTEDGEKFFFGDEYENYKDLLKREKKSMFGENTEHITPDTIKEKKLYYNKENQESIDFLYNMMESDNMKKLTKRLEKHNYPTGVCVMLYGTPGTGKTETVMQIARITNRSVYHVDISESKSMWFGESEKRIKQIFNRYKDLCKRAVNKGENMPILLFNEADAVFSKRKDVTSSNVAQTENAIQNIILEEMETLEGIMIATTNLVDNLDGAFERRFLLKIKLDNPSVENKILIWKDKINWLSENDYEKLAKTFDFSGGEIDNVARKAVMQDVLKGNLPTIDEVMEIARNEKLSSSKHIKVGFSK